MTSSPHRPMLSPNAVIPGGRYEQVGSKLSAIKAHVLKPSPATSIKRAIIEEERPETISEKEPAIRS